MNETINKIKKYSDEVLVGAARYYDQVDEFPEEHVKKIFDLGFFKTLYPTATTQGYQDYLEMIRLVSHHFPALASILLTQESHVLWPLTQFATQAQKELYVEKLVQGDMFGSFALNEENSGSDFTQMASTATPVADGWLLEGEKQYISNAPIADVFLIAAKIIGSDEEQYGVFIVNKKTLGFEIGEPEEKMGIRALPVAGITMNQCFVAKDQLLGGVMAGETQIAAILNRIRLAVTAQAIGISEGAMLRGLEYVSRKRNIGKRLIDLQSTQFKLAEIETKIYTANALLNHVISVDQTDERLVAMAKLTASDGAIETTETIINLTGGYGYMKNNDIERFIRDAKITAIYASSSDRLKKIISKPWIKRR